MMDPMDLRMMQAEAEERGEAARALLANPAFRDAIAKLTQEYIEEWRSTAPEEAAERENAYRMLSCLTRVENDLKAVLEGSFVSKHNHRRALSRLG